MTRDEFLFFVSKVCDYLDVSGATIGQLGFTYDGRVEVSLGLLVAAFDVSASAAHLLRTSPERCIVSCMALRRSQIEYVVRAAYFGSSATEAEIQRFVCRGELPRREGRGIYLAEMIASIEEGFGFTEGELKDLLMPHYRGLNEAVHGGFLIQRLYSQNDAIGDLRMSDWRPAMGEVLGILACQHFALSVAVSMSPLAEEERRAVVAVAEESFQDFGKAFSSFNCALP